MPTIADTLKTAIDCLVDVTETPRLDAEILMCHALDIDRAQLLARLNEVYPEDTQFETFLERRAQSEPIAYIVGEWEFYSLPFFVEAPVLVPRPETEHLVETAINYLNKLGGEALRILEIGTGTGCITVSCLHHLPKTSCIATDIRPGNLHLAQKNARHHGLEKRIQFVAADTFTSISSCTRFNAILSNPPYIALRDKPDLPATVRNYEDPTALFSGEEGLDIIETLITESQSHLVPGGLLAFEIGAGQHHNVIVRMEQEGYTHVTAINDLAGIPRIITGQSPCA